MEKEFKTLRFVYISCTFASRSHRREGRGSMALKGDSQAAELERLRVASQVGSVETIPKAQEVRCSLLEGPFF